MERVFDVKEEMEVNSMRMERHFKHGKLASDILAARTGAGRQEGQHVTPCNCTNYTTKY